MREKRDIIGIDSEPVDPRQNNSCGLIIDKELPSLHSRGVNKMLIRIRRAKLAVSAKKAKPVAAAVIVLLVCISLLTAFSVLGRNTTSSHVTTASTWVGLANGGFEDGVGSDWSSDPPTGYHQMPISWSSIGLITWTDSTTGYLYPFTHIENVGSTASPTDLHCLNLTTSRHTAADQTWITLRSASFALPSDAFNIELQMYDFIRADDLMTLLKAKTRHKLSKA